MSSSIPDDPGVRAPIEPSMIGPGISETSATKPDTRLDARHRRDRFACRVRSHRRTSTGGLGISGAPGAERQRRPLGSAGSHRPCTHDARSAGGRRIRHTIMVLMVPHDRYRHTGTAFDRDAGGIAGRSIEPTCCRSVCPPTYVPCTPRRLASFLPSGWSQTR